MKIKVYVDWDEGEILTAREFEDFKSDRVADILNDEYECAEYINDYFKYEKSCDYADLLFMSEEGRRELMDLATEYVAERVGDELSRVFKEVELEV